MMKSKVLKCIYIVFYLLIIVISTFFRQNILAFFKSREITPVGFLAWGAPISRLFLAPSRNKYIVKLHLTLIRFRASGYPSHGTRIS